MLIQLSSCPMDERGISGEKVPDDEVIREINPVKSRDTAISIRVLQQICNLSYMIILDYAKCGIQSKQKIN